jgi:hypothetical protein
MWTSRAIVGFLVMVATACSGGSDTPPTTLPPATTTTVAPSPTTVTPTTVAVADTAPLPAAAPAPKTGTVPNVVGIDLQLAQDTLQAEGFYVLRSHDATGQGRFQVLDRNWTVVDQDPPGGTVMSLSEVVDLGAVKDEEI